MQEIRFAVIDLVLCVGDSFCLTMPFASVLPADPTLFHSGTPTVIPYEEYDGDLPKTIVGSRPGLESVIRRCVIGNRQYPNIKQIVGTVTGFSRSSSDPVRLQEVTVRTNEGTISLSAALVVGSSISLHPAIF